MPRNYKNNVIIGNLHCAIKISSSLEQEISIIKAQYLKASYYNAFINSIIRNFQRGKEDFLILPTLFEERKEINFLVPFRTRNVEKIICKLEEYTNGKV